MNTSYPKIGFIGMGLMGVPMTLRLLAAGFNVTVWNRTPQKAAPALKKGAVLATSTSELVKKSDIIMLSITDTQAVHDIVFSENGIAQNGRAEKILIDFSSIAPDSTAEFAKRLYDACGMQWIDAPVSGGVAGAENGTLAIMAGGDANTIEKIKPILVHLSSRVTRMGEVGSGQVTKICNQMIVSCNVLVIAEVLALAEKAGVDSSQIPTALTGGFADSIPLQLTGTRMANREFEPVKWHIKTLLKDLTLASTLTTQNNAATPISHLAKQLMAQYAQAGLSDKDPAELIDCYAKQ